MTYIVTGKLGGGKTMACVDKIDTALRLGHKVATNLDLELEHFPACSKTTKDVSVVRLPDMPTAADMYALGYGIKGVDNESQVRSAYDEDKFGVIVLDECGTWLNSRDWQASGRKELLQLLLHIRKRLWRVYLIIQDISMLDKQFRKALAEHVVYCRRLDRVKIPILSWASHFFSLKKLSFPRYHYAIVKYGDNPHSLTVDKWYYRGDEYVRAYNTGQCFSAEYDAGIFTYLPPYYLFRRTLADRNWRFYMRLTKIYFRQYSRLSMLIAGLVAGVFGHQVYADFIASKDRGDVSALESDVVSMATPPKVVIQSLGSESIEDSMAYRLTSYVMTGRAEPYVMFTSSDGDSWSVSRLKSVGYDVVYDVPGCDVMLVSPDGDQTHYDCRLQPVPFGDRVDRSGVVVPQVL